MWEVGQEILRLLLSLSYPVCCGQTQARLIHNSGEGELVAITYKQAELTPYKDKQRQIRDLGKHSLSQTPVSQPLNTKDITRQ